MGSEWRGVAVADRIEPKPIAPPPEDDALVIVVVAPHGVAPPELPVVVMVNRKSHAVSPHNTLSAYGSFLAFNKLTRTFAAQMSALKEYRSKGEQKMTVQHVHVAEGGQAIVGNVNAPAPGGGANGKTGEQPHALGYAPGVEMPRQVEEERPPVPRASGSGA